MGLGMVAGRILLLRLSLRWWGKWIRLSLLFPTSSEPIDWIDWSLRSSSPPLWNNLCLATETMEFSSKRRALWLDNIGSEEGNGVGGIGGGGGLEN
ncbi:unnamed protein product [Linum trigynum]|uniref:Uncharacterized protein n=1 Tax=Linum trigynum TaxID=586398 RepID=A0AAV2FWF1_9ROSI